MWFWLSLASALIGAIEIVLSKHSLKKVSPGLLAWSSFTLTIPFVLIVAIASGTPVLNSLFFIAIIGSGLTYAFYRVFYLNALRDNLVSQLIPLTAFSGIFTYLLALIFLSETLSLIPILGMLLIIFGAYILNADQAKEDLLKPIKLLFETKASMLFLFALLLGSATAVFDKIAVINTTPESPIYTTLFEQILMSLMLTFYLLKKEKNWVGELKNNFWLLSLNSLLFLGVGLLVFYAYTDNGPVALVLGIKRIQILFVLVLGALLLQDKPTKHAWVASIFMILGTILIKI